MATGTVRPSLHKVVSPLAALAAAVLAALSGDWYGPLSEPQYRLWLMAAAIGLGAIATVTWQRLPLWIRIAGSVSLAGLAVTLVVLGQHSRLLSILTVIGSICAVILQAMGARKTGGGPVHDAFERRLPPTDGRPLV